MSSWLLQHARLAHLAGVESSHERDEVHQSDSGFAAATATVTATVLAMKIRYPITISNMAISKENESLTKNVRALLYRSFSFFHIATSVARSSSHDRCVSMNSSVSRRNCCAFMSLPCRRRSLTVDVNLASRLRANVWPGLSMRIRTNMMALYCMCPGVLTGSERILRMRWAASLAALGLDSALSTMAGRWT